MASISAREQKGFSAPGVNFTEFNIRDESGRWDESGKAPLIRVEDEFVGTLEQQLLADVGGSGDSAAGFLLGTEERGALRVTGFQPLAAAGLQSLRSVVNESNPASGPANTVGLYRAVPQENHLISRDDLVQFRERFGSRRALFLQVRVLAGQAATGVFYFGENGSLQSDRRTVEWPVNLRALGAGEVSPEPATEKEQDHLEKRRRRREFWHWLFGSAALAFTVTVVWSLWPLIQRRPAAVAPESPAPAANRPASADSPAGKANVRGAKQAAVAAAGRLDASKAGNGVLPAAPPPQVADAAGPPGMGPTETGASPVPETPAALNSGAAALAETLPPIPAPSAENRLPETPVQPPSEARPKVVPVPGDAGALVASDQPGPAPRPRLQVTPAVSPAIMRQIQGFLVVSIRVDIDESGQVIAAAPVSAASGVHSQLAAAVVDAVRRWQFEPARQGGRAVRGQTVLHFKYVNQ